MTGFARILSDLNDAGVRYVLIGGIALIRHGVVRATRDIDAVAAPDAANYTRIGELILHWRATRPDGSSLAPADVDPRRTLNLLTPHGELDLLSERAARITYEQLDAEAETRSIDGVAVPICSLAHLVALKRAAGRERDLADLRDLEAAHGELPEGPDG